MSSTITTGRVVAAVRTDQGKTLYMLFEQTYSSNVSPQVPSWDCVGLGELPATMRRIFRLASACEGGMLRGRSGRLTPEGYITTWLRELAEPLVTLYSYVHIGVGNEYSSTFGAKQLNEAIEVLTRHNRAEQASELRDTGTVTLDLKKDADALLALQEELRLDACQLIRERHVDSQRFSQRDPSLGHHPAKGRRPSLSLPEAMKVGRDARLFKKDDGEWQCGGWEYDLVSKYVRSLWKDELECPGHHHKKIKAYRSALQRAQDAPEGIMVEIDASRAEERHTVDQIERIRRETGNGQGVFRVPVTPETEFGLTHLSHECARWIMPIQAQAMPAARVDQTALAL